MTDNASGLLRAAHRSLAAANEDDFEFRRAISASYYAVYHQLAQSFADALVGEVEDERPNRAWIEVYRGLDHSACLHACKLAVSRKVSFPEALLAVADEFGQLQIARQEADYHPQLKLERHAADMCVQLAESCVSKLRTTSRHDIVAFAAWVLITTKGAKLARDSLYPVSNSVPPAKSKPGQAQSRHGSGGSSRPRKPTHSRRH
ncbi:hypothetical protein SAMN04488103_103311 [Gemmobacter aquatilis]|uniref:HEPN domain-containing protein n=1 Tax=Gemmobacter aquatilis TaxID=933059 RepID=A0A1H8EG97_9RHOB|nr:hypothetical protein SAMN04488103_103311 [Gemmobacter aquatilis]